MKGRALTDQAFFVLTVLADIPRHGYGIVSEVSDLTEGRVTLKVGTLYGVLDRLVEDGLVAMDRDVIHHGRLRRYYRLTNDGGDALEAEIQRQKANLRLASTRLRAWRPAPQGGTA